MKKAIGIFLIIAAFALGYAGIGKLQKSKTSIDIFGVEVTAKDSNQTTTAYVQIGIAVIALAGGLVMLSRK